MDTLENPYASPTADLTGSTSTDPETAEVETIRKKYLDHEASIKSIGTLYWLGCGIMTLGTIGLTVGAIIAIVTRGDVFVEAIFGLIYPVFAVLFGWLGYGFGKLDPRVRIPGGVLSVIGLVGFPIGTIINAYFLYLIFSAKGKFVFSPEYKEIIAKTPHIKYRTSIVAWIVLFLLIAAIVAFIMLPFFVQRSR